MSVYCSYDYLSISMPHPTQGDNEILRNPRQLLARAGMPRKLYNMLTPAGWQPHDPLRFYSHGWQEQWTRAMLHVSERNSGRCLLQVPGRARGALNSRPQWPNWMALGRTTRIDVAWDIIGWELPAADWWDTLPENQKPKDTYTRVDRSRGGTTVYIGRRTHSKMIRIYDKKAEDTAWRKAGLRVELEIKKGTARKWGEFLDRGPTVFAPLAFQCWPGLADTVPGIVMVNAIDGDIPPLRAQVEPAGSGKQTWWDEQVAPGWANWYKEDEMGAIKALERLIAMYVNR